MPRITTSKTRQALLVVGEPLDPDFAPERLALFDQNGNQLNFGGRALPVGGLENQVLTKASDSDFDVEWAASSGGGGTSDVAQAYQDAVLRDEPVAYWPLTEDISDLSGNGHDFTSYGSVDPGMGDPGPFGPSSTYFNGDDDRLVNADTPVLSLLGQPNPNVLTLEMWMKPLYPTTVGASEISGAGWSNWPLDGSGSGSNGAMLGVLNPIMSNKVGYSMATLFESIDFNEWGDRAQGYVQANRWNHLAVMLGYAQIQYNNGFWRSFGQSPGTGGIVQFFVGGYGVAPNKRFFNGHIAHVALYDRPLPIRRLMDRERVAQFDF